MKMNDDGARITLRMGPEEIQMMDSFMEERGIANRSDFIRDAIKGYIESQNAPKGGSASKGGIFVRLSEMHLDALGQVVQSGICLDEEEFIRRCVLDRIITKTVEEDALSNAFMTAQRNAALK